MPKINIFLLKSLSRLHGLLVQPISGLGGGIRTVKQEESDELWMAHRFVSSQDTPIGTMLKWLSDDEVSEFILDHEEMIRSNTKDVARRCLALLDARDSSAEKTIDIRNTIRLILKDPVLFLEKVAEDKVLLTGFHEQHLLCHQHDDHYYARCAEAVFLPIHMSFCMGAWPPEESAQKVSSRHIKTLASACMRLKKLDEDRNHYEVVIGNYARVACDLEKLADTDFEAIYQMSKQALQESFKDIETYLKNRQAYLDVFGLMLEPNFEVCMWSLGERIAHGELPAIEPGGPTARELGFGDMDIPRLNRMINVAVGYENDSFLKDILQGLHKTPDKTINEVIADTLGLSMLAAPTHAPPSSVKLGKLE